MTADANQVYLFMVVFGSILFGTPPLLKLYRYCRPEAGSGSDPSGGVELWDFQDEFDDMRDVKDPLELENNLARKGQKKKKKQKANAPEKERGKNARRS